MTSVSNMLPLILLVPAGFVGVKISGMTSDWTKLSRIYPYSGDLPYENYWKSVNIYTPDHDRYTKSAHVALDDKGLYFETRWLFRWAYPSIFVPWSDISITKTKYLLAPMTKLTFKKLPEVPFHLIGDRYLSQELSDRA